MVAYTRTTVGGAEFFTIWMPYYWAKC